MDRVSRKYIATQTAIVRTIMVKLSKIWRNISKVTKIRLVNTLIFPIARYASEM